MSPRQSQPLRELAATLGHELELQAVPSSLHMGGFPEPRQTLVYVLMDPEGYVAIEGERALPGDRILRRTVFVCAESPPAATEDERVALLRRAGAVFVLDRRSVAAMHRLGISARLIRPGYAKSLDRFDPAAPRPIDVLFLGTHSLRRTKYLSRAARVLSRHNCVLQISDYTPNAGDTSASLAEARWPLLAQAKVLISIHRDEQSRFDWGGALDAIHAGVVVVTEPSGGVAPLVAGEHLVVSGADSLPYVVEDLLGDEQRLARLRSGAYERLRAWIPYALSVAVLRAAVVELVGEPVLSEAALGRPRPEPAGSDTPVTPAAQDGTSEIEAWSPEATRVAVAHESPAWGSRRAPRVTAVATLRNGDEEIAATLDSLAHSALRDFELVLVARWDSEQTRRTVADWMSAHPDIASRLVAADVCGVGAARNIGLDFARGAFCVVLAPGQEFYPRCLHALTRTLEATPEVAFAYPIHEVTGALNDFVQSGGDYLLNYLGWDPERVRVRNDIHTPALIRTDWLRRLGGFATDPRLAGLEDDDLWRRIAEQGWRGQLVPQALARRPVSAASPALSVPQP
jgi:Glycosyl transferase family 2